MTGRMCDTMVSINRLPNPINQRQLVNAAENSLNSATAALCRIDPILAWREHRACSPPAARDLGSNLLGWTDITIPATSSGAVTITPGMPTDHLRVVILSSGVKLFARLKASERRLVSSIQPKTLFPLPFR